MKNRLKVLRAEYDPSLPLAFKIAKLFNVRIEEAFIPEEAEPT